MTPYRCPRCRRRAIILRVVLPILALITLAALSYGLIEAIAAHKAAKREKQALTIEVGGLRQELKAAKLQLERVPELRFIALAFEANDPELYTAARAAWQFSRRHDLSPNLVLAVAYKDQKLTGGINQ